MKSTITGSARIRTRAPQKPTLISFSLSARHRKLLYVMSVRNGLSMEEQAKALWREQLGI